MKRIVLLGLSLLTAAGALTACGSNDPAPAAPGPSGSASASGSFTFTDDRGETVSLPAKPKRIVVQSSIGAALWDLGVRPVGVFGPQKLADGTQDAQSGNIDLTTTTSVGQAYGEFNLEEFLKLKPDLVITTVYSDLLWYVPEDAQKKIEAAKIPIVGVKLEATDIPTGIGKLEKLATALGQDVNAPAVASAKANYDTAATAFTAAVKAKPDLRVVPVSGFGDNFYVGDPTYLGGLKTMAGLGLTLPAADGKGGAYENLSWEQVGKYGADLYLQDSRDPANVAVFNTKSTWTALPAVKAGQVYPWNPETPYSWILYAKLLNDVAADITNAKSV